MTGIELIKQGLVIGEGVGPISGIGGITTGAGAIEIKGAVFALFAVVGQKMGAGWHRNGITQIGVVNKYGARLFSSNAFNNGALEVAINYGGVVLPLHLHIDLI